MIRQNLLTIFLIFIQTLLIKSITQMTDLNNQPKTIDDYRDIVKILKLKVMKQMKRIQQLEQKVKLYQSQQIKIKSSRIQTIPLAQQQAQKDFDYSNLKNKSIVMYLFQKGAQKLGITLEGIFRYADINYKNEIDSDEFRKMLSKMNLGLTLKQISCLIFIFDQNCVGKINKQDYYNSLEAYQVHRQSKSKLYTQKCLLKFSQLIQQHRIELNTFYDQMIKTQPSVDANVFQAFLKKKFGKLITERQIIGTFNQIDFQAQGYIQKSNFLYSVRSYISKAKYTDQKIVHGQTQQSLFKSNVKQGKKQKTPQKIEKLNVSRIQKVLDSASRYANTSQLNQQKQQKAFDVVQPNLQDVLDYFHQKKFSLITIYPQILNQKFDRPITLFSFSRILKGIDPQNVLENRKICQLFMLIDKNRKGSIYIKQFLQFFMRNQIDQDIMFKIFSKYFYLNDMNASKFFFINQMNQNSSITKKQFFEIFTSNFKLQQKIFESLWEVFDKQKKGSVKVQTILKQFSRYQSNS